MNIDEKGFVFIDSSNRPFLCAMWWDTEPWLFRWNEYHGWVSLRKLSQQEIWCFYELKIPDDQGNMYHKRNEELSTKRIKKLKGNKNGK